VYVAHDTLLGRDVALKVLRRNVGEVVGRERFEREIRIVAGLQHANILPLYDSGVDEGRLFYVMPFVVGDTLRTLLSGTGKLPVPQVVRIIREAGAALDHAHARGVLHRDMKPENILLDAGRVLVADFGIARLMLPSGEERDTTVGLTVGTPGYMSPEQAVGSRELDARSDVYSLGCMAYEMLVGVPPFVGLSPQVIIAQHIATPPPPLAQVRPDLPPALTRVVATALSKSAADRYASAGLFAEALGAASEELAGRVSASAGLSASISPSMARGGNGLILRRWLGVAAGLLVLVLVAGWVVARARTDQRPSGHRVAVFPLHDSDVAEAGRGSGYDVATYLGFMLEGTEPLTWVEASDWTTGGEALAELTPVEKRRFTRRHGAAYYVDGSILRSADSIQVILRLLDVNGDEVVARASRSGGPDASPSRLAAQAAGDLFPRLIDSTGRIDVGALRDRKPTVIASFLQGERAYRVMEFPIAIAHYQRALLEDSTFALASLKAAMASEWQTEYDSAMGFVDAALRREPLLTRRDALFAHGLKSYLAGDADSSAAVLRRALELAPDWVEGWMALGEVHYHLLPRDVARDSIARDAFQRASRADSQFAPPLFHLAEIALRAGDTSAARALAARFSRVSRDSMLSRELALMLRCAGPGLTTQAWDSLVHAEPVLAIDVAKAGATIPGAARCAVRGLEAVVADDSLPPGQRFWPMFALHGLRLAQGRPEEALAVLSSPRAKALSADLLLLVGAATHLELRAAAESIAARVGTRYDTLPGRYLWLLGRFRASQGDTAATGRIAAASVALAAATGEPVDALFRDVIAAHDALARADTTLAIGRFQALTTVGSLTSLTWSPWAALGGERLRLAQLLLARGDAIGAIEVASTLDSQQPAAFLVDLRASLELRAQAASLLGLAPAESRYRKRLAVLALPE
jgi:serine/threonine-protein kinase